MVSPVRGVVFVRGLLDVLSACLPRCPHGLACPPVSQRGEVYRATRQLDKALADWDKYLELTEGIPAADRRAVITRFKADYSKQDAAPPATPPKP